MTIPCDDQPTREVPSNAASSDSFDAFFRATYPGTVRLAHLLTGSNAVAEELAQDAFANIYPRYNSLQTPRSYLRAATVNVCRNWYRSRTREVDRFRRHGVSETETSSEVAELLDTIRKLPYRQRAVLVLRYWLDLSEADIAETLGCRAGTVKSLHSRALTAIRKELQ